MRYNHPSDKGDLDSRRKLKSNRFHYRLQIVKGAAVVNPVRTRVYQTKSTDIPKQIGYSSERYRSLLI